MAVRESPRACDPCCTSPAAIRWRRAHQGWRYLEADDAPADLDGDSADGLAAMPAALVGKLSELALI